jgi:ABC-type polysaccharide/polyol phosphate export permease
MNILVKCFFELVRRELVLFFKEIFSRFIDTGTLLATNAVVFTYMMSAFISKEGFGQFIIVGAIATFGLFEIVGRVATFINDITGDKLISNYLILPLPSFFVFVSIAFGWALGSLATSFFMFPLAKLILWNHFDLSNFVIYKFILITALGSLLFAFFAIWLASLIKSLNNIGWLWCRIINPLFMFSAYFYSWQSLFQLNKTIAYFNFLNPFLYILEGTRACVLGQKGYMSYWICCPVIIVIILFFMIDGIKRLQRRLDCV